MAWQTLIWGFSGPRSKMLRLPPEQWRGDRTRPELFGCPQNPGGVRQAAWDWSGAEAEYQRAIALNHNSAGAHGDLGGLLDNLGRLDEGWKEQQIAFELDPNNADLFNFTLSCGLELRGQYDRAIAIYQMFLKRDPDNGYTHLGLARDYTRMGMYKEAMPHWEQFWTLFGFPDVSVEVHHALATGDTVEPYWNQPRR